MAMTRIMIIMKKMKREDMMTKFFLVLTLCCYVNISFPSSVTIKNKTDETINYNCDAYWGDVYMWNEKGSISPNKSKSCKSCKIATCNVSIDDGEDGCFKKNAKGTLDVTHDGNDLKC